MKQGISLIGMQLWAYFYACTIVSCPMIIPTVSPTTCSQLVSCCMRIWGEMRYHKDVGDGSLWSKDAIDAVAIMQSLIEDAEKEQYSGLSRENIEYIIHLADRIGAECEAAIENSGSQIVKKEFLITLAHLWLQLRHVMVQL